MDVRRIALLLIIACAVAAFFYFDLARFLSFDYLSSQRDALAALIEASPLLYAAIYFGIYVVVTGLSLPGAAVMTLAGGALFGLFWGTLIVSFASSIGATLAFLVSRFLLRDWVQRRFGRQLGPIDRGVARDGAFYLFSLRLVPVFPFFVINLVMGLTSIRVVTFYLASQLGMFAGTVVYVYAGTQLAEIESLGDVLSPGLLLAFLLLAAFPWVARAITNRIQARRVLAAFERPQQFDDNLVVIGAGSGGLIAALIAATVKAKVTLIERHRMGGDCLNTGCVPSKTLITSARVAKTLSEAPRFGFAPVQPVPDFARVMERVQEAIATIEPNDSPERYESLGVRVVQGEGRIVDPWTVEVNGERIRTRAIVIATGGRPALPPIPGIEDVAPLTSDDVWELRDLPARLLVLGTGPIGCELAQAFARLGSEVTMVQRGKRILSAEDEDAAAVVKQSLLDDGVVLRQGVQPQAFRPGSSGAGDGVRAGDGNGGVLEIRNADGTTEELAFDRVLVAVGRQAVTAGLGLEELGVRTNADGTLEVDEYLQTSVPTIYGCGDVVGPYLFTHIASHQAWFAAVNALFGTFRRFKVNYSVVPWCTYTEPELARVGLNEDQAREQEVEVEVATFEFAHNDRAIAEDERRGFVKVLTPAGGSDRILGVTIVGPHAGELLAEWTLAMTHGIGLKKLMGTIHVYPTLAEINKSAASAWRKKHVPETLLGWVGRFHALRR